MIESVAVTGASGFVGRTLVKKLIEKNYRVIGLTRGINKRRHNLWPPEVETRIIDWDEKDSIRQAVRGADAVIHAAAIHPPRSMSNKEKIIQFNVEGTKKLLESIESVDKFIMVSSMRALLNKNEPNTTFDSDSDYDFEEYDTPYGLSKRLSEQVCREFSEKYKLPLITINPTPIIGEGDFGPSPNGEFILSFLKSATVYMVETTYSFVDVFDVATAIVFLLDKGATGERYLLNAANWELRTFIEKVLSAAQMNKKIVAIPLPLAYFLAVIFEYLEKINPNISAPVVRSSIHFAKLRPFFDGTKITELGFTYTDPEITLKNTVKWLLENFPVNSTRGH